MSTFENIVHSKLNSYINNENKSIFNHKFILALSGGVDSMALFYCLRDLGLCFYTIHFDHNYHSQSTKCSEFLNFIVQELNSKKHFNISLNLSVRKNFESDARDKRYFHLGNLRRRLNCDYILTAHHLDDQIETLHMRKIQNAYWSNSLGILEKRGFVRRPLLSLFKDQIIDYAKEKKIRWIEDPTNINNSFLRNKIRNIELPKLLSVNPNYSSELLYQQAMDIKSFDEIVRKIKKADFSIKRYAFGISLDLLQFSNFGKVGKKLIIQHNIDENFKTNAIRCSYSNWKNLFIYLGSENKRATLFPLSNKISIYRGKSNIYIIKNSALTYEERIINGKCSWFDGSIIVSELQYFRKYTNKYMASLPLNSDYKVRQWKTSDTYISATSGYKCKVSDLFINKKMNYIQKRIQPIVADLNDTILWIPGLAHASIQNNSKYRKYLWKPSKC